MEGINSSGRRVSLLNDDAPLPPPVLALARALPTAGAAQVDAAAHRSRSRSGSPDASSPRSSARSAAAEAAEAAAARNPPPLSMSSAASDDAALDSCDSSPWPSPATPDTDTEMSFEPVAYHHHHHHHHHDSSRPDHAHARPQLSPAASLFAYGAPQSVAALSQQKTAATATTTTTTTLATMMSTATATTSPKAPAYLQNGVPRLGQPFATALKTGTKKNQYPCPVSKQYNCHDFFTTSGHAARHAKKHTGKKDAVCPECGKAFTRKDNMEQHRRTHAGGRGLGQGLGLATSPTSTSITGPTPSKAQFEAAQDRRVRQQQQQQRRRSRSSIVASPSSSSSAADFALDPQLHAAAHAQAAFSPVSERSYPHHHHHHHSSSSTAAAAGGHTRPEYRRASQDSSIAHSRMHSSSFQSPYQFADARADVRMGESLRSPSLAPALDALALAASRQ